MLIFSISSVSSQSVNNSNDLYGNDKVLKSNSLCLKTTTLSATAKVGTNGKVTNDKTANKKTATKTSSTKKTTVKKASTTSKTNTAKKTTAKSTAKKTNKTKTATNKTNTTKKTSTTTTVNKKTLAKTSTSFMNHVEKKGKFPKVKISNRNYSNTEYLYLISKAVENDSNSKIEINKNLVKPYNNTKSKSVKGSLNKTEYVQIAKKTRKFIEKNRRAPNWESSSKGNIPYNQLILLYSKCLDSYNKTNKLPNTVKLDDLDLDAIQSKINKNSTTKTTKSSVNTAKTTVKNTTKANATKNTNIAKTTVVKKTNSTNNKIETNTVENPIDDGNKTLAEKSMDYIHSLLDNLLDRLDPSKFKINLTKTDEGNVKFNTSKFNIDLSGKSSVNVQVSAKNTSKTTAKTSSKKKTTTKKAKTKTTTAKKATTKKTTTKTSSTKKTTTKSTVKTTKIAEALKKYLSSSKNCQVKNIDIKNLAAKLTSTLKTDYDKGKKLFEWVRDNIGYDNYRNTRRGAVKTLKNKIGNCVDQSHLLVALSRAAGIPARYVNANNCKFSTGYVSGHVWGELYIKNKWVPADTTSSRNSLGTIRNWNTKSFSLVGRYSSLNF